MELVNRRQEQVLQTHHAIPDRAVAVVVVDSCGGTRVIRDDLGNVNAVSRSSPRGLHLRNDLLRDSLDSLLVSGRNGLAAFGNEVGGLGDGERDGREVEVGILHQVLAAAVVPIDLNDQIRLDVARDIVHLFGDNTLRIGEQARGEHRVGIRPMYHLIRRLQLDLADNSLGQSLAQISPQAIGFEHRHIDRANVGAVERASADLIAGASQ